MFVVVGSYSLGNDGSNYYFLTVHLVNSHRHLEDGLAVFSPRKSINVTNQDSGNNSIFFFNTVYQHTI